jgi:hypothetical protein
MVHVPCGVTATKYAPTSAKQEKVISAKNPLTGVYRKSCTCQPVTRYISTNGFFVYLKDGPGPRSNANREPDQHSRKATEMATPNNTKLHIIESNEPAELFCPHCAHPMDATKLIKDLTNIETGKTIHTEWVEATCWQQGCPLSAYTLGPSMLQSIAALTERKATLNFDIFTGKAVA